MDQKKVPPSYVGLENPETRTIHLSEAIADSHTYRPSAPGGSFQHILMGKYLWKKQIWNFPPSEHSLKIGKLLGKGGYGEVYEISLSSKIYPKFALKIPGQPLSLTKGYILNEIHKLRILNKPGNYHIPKIQFGSFYLSTEEIPYYITHIFKPGERLFGNFANHLPMDPIQTIEIFYMMACGLKYITSHHIVHNDLKPENVMFLYGLPVITDYGTARSYSEINELELERLEGRLHGTPVWLPPELISIQQKKDKPEIYFNLGKVGQKTDVWGLALLLMRYLTGESLFHDVCLTYKIPDIFWMTYKEFTEAKILHRYRQYAYRKLQRLYEIKYPMESAKLDVERIKNMLFDDQALLGNKKENRNFLENACDLESQPTSKALLCPLYQKKRKLQQRQHSSFEIQEFFLLSLFDLFDMCTANHDERIKIYQLVDLLEIIFPGMVVHCQKEIQESVLPDLVSLEMEA